MDRLRTNIESDYDSLVENYSKVNTHLFQKNRDKLILEVLLDIRDSLNTIKKNTGIEKWGPKI